MGFAKTANFVTTIPVSISPTISSDTNIESKTLIHWRMGRYFYYDLHIAWSGAGDDAAAFTVTLPGGIAADDALLAGAISTDQQDAAHIGSGMFFNAGVNPLLLSCIARTSTVIGFHQHGGGMIVGTNAGAGDSIKATGRIPIVGWA